jgi:glutathione S-transferase
MSALPVHGGAGALRLYQGMGPNSYRVRIFMAERGIGDVEMVEVRLDHGEHRTDAFRALNSLGRIPVLALPDGTAISESVAICRYLDETRPGTPLFGAEPVERATIEMWSRRIEQEIFATIGNVALHGDPFFAERLVQFPAFAEAERGAVAARWTWLDAEMSDGRAFIAGENFSAADATGMVASWLGEILGIGIPETARHVLRWDERMRDRPSWNA